MKQVFDLLEKSVREYFSEITFQDGKVVSLEDVLKQAREKKEGYKSGERYFCQVQSKSLEQLVELLSVLGSSGIGIPVNTQVSEASLEHIKKDAEKPDPTATEDVRMLLYTSGSTGMPKGVKVTDGMLVNGIRDVQKALGYNRDARVANFLPWYFDAGLNHLLVALASGADVLVAQHLFPSWTMREIEEFGATHLLGIPTLWEALTSSEEVNFGVKQIANTGGPLTAKLVEKIKKTFPNATVVPMYGLTEGFRCAIGEEFDPQRANFGGYPLDHAKVLVVDQNLEIVPTGEVGQIVQQGDLVSPGYWNQKSEKFLEFKGEHSLLTGDYGYLTSDGGVCVIGRIDEMMKVRGVRVSPSEVEAAAPTRSTASVAFQREDGTPVLALECSDPGAMKGTERLEVLSLLPAQFLDMEIVYYEKMPRLSNGKVARRKVRNGSV